MMMPTRSSDALGIAVSYVTEPELSVADVFAFGNAASAHTAELERKRAEAAPREDSDDA